MSRKILLVVLTVLFLPPVYLARAQQPAKIPRIGFLAATKPAAVAARTEAFRQGLRELGYVEGKNIVVDYRYAEGNADRERELAAELVRLKVDIIVTTGPTVTRNAKEATATIPIVFAQDGDPVASGFVASLARPGGNITGLSNLSPELSGKRLEFLKEIVPKLSRVAAIGGSNEPNNAQILKELELAAGALKVKLQTLDVRSPADIETAFQAAAKGRADGSRFAGERRLQCSSKADCRACGQAPAAGDIHQAGICRRRRADDLRAEYQRSVSTRRDVCRQDFKRQETRRPAGRAADQVRVHRKSESSQANRPDDSAENAPAGGSR